MNARPKSSQGDKSGCALIAGGALFLIYILGGFDSEKKENPLVAPYSAIESNPSGLPSNALADQSHGFISNLPANPTNAAVPTVPKHGYAERRGSNYYYIAAVSDEDKQRGIAVGSVSIFQFLGVNEKGEYELTSINDDGSVNGVARCKKPCRIIDRSYAPVLAYNENSVIGQAFKDAMDGHLKVAAKPAKPVTPDTLPADFFDQQGQGEGPIANSGSSSNQPVTDGLPPIKDEPWAEVSADEVKTD